jgi:hypothetical protein
MARLVPKPAPEVAPESIRPADEMPFGSVTHAAIPGARPNVDSMDRSILPVSSTSDSPSTSIAIGAISPLTSVSDALVMNAGSTK